MLGAVRGGLMAIPRRATLTAHINYSRFRLSELSWIRLGRIAGAPLDDNTCNEIGAAVNQYIEDILLLQDGADRAGEIRKKSSPIGKWYASATKTVAAWEALSLEQRLTLLQFEPAMKPLVALGPRLNEFGTEIAPIEDNPAEAFICRLADAIKSAGGRVTASGDTSDRKRLSRFQRFVAVLNCRLPQGVRGDHSRDALAGEVNKALIKWRAAR